MNQNYIRKNYIEFAFALIALCAGLYFSVFSITGFNLSKVPGDFGDARFNNYILEHCHQFFTFQTNGFWDGRFIYPEADVITYSDNLLGTAPLYSVFRICTASPATSFQLWYIVLSVLNFLITLWVFYKWSGSYFTAAAGAYIFAFSIAIFGQINYAQCFPRFPIPIAFYFVHLFFLHGNFKHLLYGALAVVYQFYAGIYLGLFLTLAMFLFILCCIFIFRKNYATVIKNDRLTAVFKLCGIILISIALLAPLLLPYIARARISGARAFEEIVPTIPHLKSYLFCYHDSLLWKPLESIGLDLPIWYNHLLFPGFIALSGILFISIALAFKKTENSKTATAFLISLLLLFLLTTNFNGFTLYKFVYNLIPGYNSMRVIGRVINIELFFLAAFVVFLIKDIKFKNTVLHYMVLTVLLSAIIADNKLDGSKVINYDKKESELRINYLVEKIKATDYKKYKAVACLNYDSTCVSSFFQIDAMLACQQLNMPVVNGYSATSPECFSFFWSYPDEANLKTWLDCKNIPASEILIIK